MPTLPMLPTLPTLPTLPMLIPPAPRQHHHPRGMQLSPQLCAEQGWDGMGWASHGQVWQQKALGSPLLPGRLRGPGWGELGDFPLFGVFRGKRGGQVGFAPRVHWLVGEEIVEMLEVVFFISFTAREQKAQGPSPGQEPLALPSHACSDSPG